MTLTPPCCSPLKAYWPWAQELPGARLVNTRYDPRTFTPDAFSECRILLPPELTDAADKRKTEYLVGRLCAREAVKFVTGYHAAPSLGADRAPCWPAGTAGSVTHSHGWAAAIVASSQHYLSLGLDAEALLSDSRATKLAQKILTIPERQRFRSELAQRPGQLITLAFSVKESLFKALYPLTRKRFYFEDAELLECSVAGRAQVRLLKNLSEDWRAGQQLTAWFSQQDGRLLSLVTVAVDDVGSASGHTSTSLLKDKRG